MAREDVDAGLVEEVEDDEDEESAMAARLCDFTVQTENAETSTRKEQAVARMAPTTVRSENRGKVSDEREMATPPGEPFAKRQAL